MSKNVVAWVATRLLSVLSLIALARGFNKTTVGLVLSTIALAVLLSAFGIGAVPQALAAEVVPGAPATAPKGAFVAVARRQWLTMLLFASGFALLRVSRATHLPFTFALVGASLGVSQTVQALVAGVFRGLQRYNAMSLFGGFASSALRTVIILLSLVVHLHATGMLLAIALGDATLAASLFVWVSRIVVVAESEGREKYGRLHFAGLIWTLLANADILAVSILLGVTAAGQYGPVMRLAELGSQGAGTFAAVYLPQAAALTRLDDKNALAILFHRMSEASGLVSLALCTVVFCEAPQILSLALHSYTLQQLLVTRVLLFGYFIHASMALNADSLIVASQDKPLLTATAATCVVLLISMPVLTLYFSLVGAAVASVLGYVTLNGLWQFYAFRRTGIAFTAARACRLTTTSVLVLALGWAASVLLPLHGLLKITLTASLIVGFTLVVGRASGLARP